MGSIVAQGVALLAPERVERLVLIGSATTVRNQAVLEFQRAVEKLVDPVPEEFARDFQVSCVHQPVPNEFMDRIVAQSRKAPARVWRAVMAGMLAGDYKTRLDSIRTPTLIVWGDRDAFFLRAEQDSLAATLPNAVLKVYPETGHCPNWERPEQFAQDLKEFINRTETPAAPASAHHHHAAAAAKPAPVMTGLGERRHPVSTRNAEAQRFFDQGLALVYAFNHEEAARSFRHAAELDPQLAMAYWGIALAVGPNYNEATVDAERVKAACEAVQKAQSLAAGATERERSYIGALATRFSSDPEPDYKKLALAYRDAMRELHRRYPDDLDAATLFADSMMNVRPWQLWTKDGKPADAQKRSSPCLKRRSNASRITPARTTCTSTRSRPRHIRSAPCRARRDWRSSRRRPAISSTCPRTSTSARAITRRRPKATRKLRRLTARTLRRLASRAPTQ